MSSPIVDDRSGNPFSTRHVRPGAIPFVYPTGENVDVLLARLERSGWRGQIVGPHGSGKSTLLAELTEALTARGWQPLLVALHDGERRLPVDLRQYDGAERLMVIVDGYEQLAWWNRWRLRRQCRRRQWGLLVTAHESVGLPLLAQTSTSPQLARRIIDRLLPGDGPITAAEIAERFTAHQGNLREVLFDLYDLYEARRPRGAK